jgi:hypothetical protein
MILYIRFGIWGFALTRPRLRRVHPLVPLCQRERGERLSFYDVGCSVRELKMVSYRGLIWLGGMLAIMSRVESDTEEVF